MIGKIVRALNRPSVHILIILVLGAAVYSNTLSAPFQSDEQDYIIRNPFVRDACTPLSTLEGLKSGKGGEIFKSIQQRYVGYLTFALNYRIGGLKVKGYHILNISVHLLSAVLVYAFIVLLFRSPVLTTSLLAHRSRGLALVVSLLFAVHPVQTEAVTYIMQRLTSLMTCFYLLSLVLYMKWRIADRGQGMAGQSMERVVLPIGHRSGRAALLYVGSVLAALLAMKTKENAVTLPAMIGMSELLFFSGPVGKRIRNLIPFIITALVVPVTTLFLLGHLKSNGLTQLVGARPDVGHLDYLITELRVINTYIRLLLYPVHQNFWYDYPVYRSLWELPVLLSALVEVVLAAGALYSIRRARNSDSGLKVVGFGIYWFYLALSVESAIVPLPFVINEYRLYLPSVGFILAAISLIFLLAGRIRSVRLRYSLAVIATAVIVALGSAAFARNRLWNDSIALWTDVVNKGPKLGEAYKNLGFAYLRAGRAKEAVAAYRTGLRLTEDHPQPHDFFGGMLQDMGHPREAEEEFKAAIALDPGYVQAHYDLASLYTEQKRYPDALREYKEVLRLDPEHVEARNNLAGILVATGKYETAMRELRVILAAHPDMKEVQDNLQVVSGLVRQKEPAGSGQ